ncbi:MAG: class I SAM-dependent methyltransferase [Mycobacterium sp.]
MPPARRIRADLTGAPQTMLATLYAKAVDAGTENPVLGDTLAREVVDRIDYDWSKTSVTPRNSGSVTVRTVHFDSWTRQFLAVHDRAVVLHLGCGLDSRVFRVDPGPGVDWYDVDHPDVIALRHQLYPARAHTHLVAAASVTDPGWVTELHGDRPTLMVAEGLTMYLPEGDGVALLRSIVDHFPSGELQFDAFNWLGIKAQVINAVVRRSGATLQWAINGPDDIIRAVPGVRLLAAVSFADLDTFQRVPRLYRLIAATMSVTPATRNMAQFHRYAF